MNRPTVDQGGSVHLVHVTACSIWLAESLECWYGGAYYTQVYRFLHCDKNL